ncbi:MAG TPA: S41 family peptidase [Mycobacteriales bacterium]|nr:S41 family peptidase [Mycobacteriales bacterium]
MLAYGRRVLVGSLLVTASWAGWGVVSTQAMAAGRGGESTASVAAHAYLRRALTLIEQRDIFAERVRWAVEWRSLSRRFERSPTIGTADSLIEQALSDIGDRHGYIVTKTAQRPGPSSSLTIPYGRVLAGEIGYLSLPATTAQPGSANAVRYASRGEALVRSLYRRGAKGWVVDLRLNGGGDIFPMLLAIGGLLDGDRVLGFRDRSGSTTWIGYRDSALYVGDKRVMAAPVAEPEIPANARVALLVGPETVSSGEAVVVALHGRPDTRTFGLATAGEAVAVSRYPLAGRRVLEMSSAYDVDRFERAYIGPIPPDTVMWPARSDVDQTLTAAVAWTNPSRGNRDSVVWTSISLVVLVACAHIAQRLGGRKSDD